MSDMRKSKNNSVIYRNVDETENLIDFSNFGTNDSTARTMILQENNHYFIPGDAIYYDYLTNHFRKALAVNNVMSEVIGVVSKIIDNNTFELTLRGNIILDRYNNIPNSTPLFLSDIITGKLIKNEPVAISKIVAVKINSGINVNIQRGYFIKETLEPDYSSIRFYTEQEINDIIDNIISDIY